MSDIPTNSRPVAKATWSDGYLTILVYVPEEDITLDSIMSLARSAAEHGSATVGSLKYDRPLQWDISIPVASSEDEAKDAALDYLEQYLNLQYSEKEEPPPYHYPDIPRPVDHPYIPYDPTKIYPGMKPGFPPGFPGEPYVTD